MINRAEPKINSVSFTAAPEVVAKLAKAGVSRNKICSSYIGYTGPKALRFPTKPNLPTHLYPDVTEHYNALVKSALDATKKVMGKNKFVNFYKKCRILCENFKTADRWDTKFMENFPGRDKRGKVQYALFKGKVVSANHMSNYIYAEVLFHLGFTKWMAVTAGKIYSQGAINILFDKALPSVKALMYKDTPHDQLVIKNAYEDFQRGNHLFA